MPNTATAHKHCAICVEDDFDDDVKIIGDCILCDLPTCVWHGREYHAWKLNGICHNDCFSFGVDD